MTVSLQKASFGKRIIASIFDGIMVAILAIGLAVGLSEALDYNGYFDTVNTAYAEYGQEYGVELKLSAEQYNALSEQERAKVDEAMVALNKDTAAVYAYNMLINLTLIITTASVFFGVLIVEFIVPLFFKNGQTLGKKIFGIALMHVEGYKISGVQLFARTVLGKFTFEIIIPLIITMMIFMGLMGLAGPIVILAILIAEIFCLAYTKKNMLLHDVIGTTVAVDFLSQRIFENIEEKEEHIRRQAELDAEKAPY